MTVQNITDTHLTKEIDSLRALLETEDNKHLKTFKMNALNAMLNNPYDIKVQSDYQRAFEYVSTRQYNKGAQLMWLAYVVLGVTAILGFCLGCGFLLGAPLAHLLLCTFYITSAALATTIGISLNFYFEKKIDNADIYKLATVNGALPKANLTHRFFSFVGLNSEKTLSNKILNNMTSEAKPQSSESITLKLA